MNLKRKSVKGFTLTEMIVVIAIIGVLTATLVIAVGAFIRDNKYNDANSKAEALYRALQIKLNQYDAEKHMTHVGGTRVEGICGIQRPTSGPEYAYVGNGLDMGNLGEGVWFGGSGPFNGSTITSYDYLGYDNSFVMEGELRTICNETRLQQNNPSWLAKIDMQTYTVCYVIYTEDHYDLTNSTNGFLDRSATDTKGYYLTVDEQQTLGEYAIRDEAIIGCYPIQSMYD